MVFLCPELCFMEGAEMAENKKSFLLYTDVHFTVKKLTDEQAGKLFKHILGYVNDENPVMDDILIDLVFEPIKQSLKRDLRKYEQIREKRSIAGKASADKRQQVSTSVKHDEQVLTHSTVNDSVIVNDIVNDNVNVKTKNKKKTFTPPQLSEVITYFIENGYKEETAIKMFKSYSVANWVDSKGNQVNNWKQKAINVWFRDENKVVINNDDLEYQQLKEKLYGKSV
jgi:hypothetical protein